MARYIQTCCVAAVLFVVLSPVFGASAGELKVPLSTCTALDCAGTNLLGRINKSVRCCGFFNYPIPWTIQLYAAAGECLRLHVTSQQSDTQLVAVAPGTMRTWRNDSSGIAACTTCPLLKIVPATTETGWFLVQVNQPQGTSADAEFTLKYARYSTTAANCSPVSTPLPAPPK